MNKLSVVIITLNEEKNIGRCIDAVQTIADEIIVLDSFSTDTTIPIALAKGAIVHQQSFAGYIQQKNRAVKLASNDYVLSIDADEVLSDELIQSIAKAKNNFENKAYCMHRCNIYRGHAIRYGLWYPDTKLRLFDRRIGQFGGLNPHDKVLVNEKIIVKKLSGDLLHYTYQSIDEYITRNEEISTIAAEALFYTGKKVHWAKIILSPLWCFINGYFFRLGFLNGVTGFVIATLTASQSYKKYYKLKQLQKHTANKLSWQNAKVQS